MKKNHTSQKIIKYSAAVALALIASLVGCKKSGDSDGSGTSSSASPAKVISVQGSDTMVNEAQAWAEAYAKVNPDISVEVGGGGSGVGIAALIANTIDSANASRDMKPSEREKAKANSGKEPKEFTVGYDALAIFVHKDNPLKEITLEQLAAIYAEGGATTKWSDLGVHVPGCPAQHSS
jgi:phosphate transport system substrate-binding protein